MSDLGLGDHLLVLGMLAWLMFSVGPWWLGLLLYGVCWAANVAEARR
jgi:hypothetical protein